MNAPESSDLSEVTSESAAPDPSAERPALTDIGEQLHQGCSVDINEIVDKIADAGQSGTNDSGQAVVELEQPRDQDRPIVSDGLNETQALSSNVSDIDASKSQVMDSDSDGDYSESIADELSETNSQGSIVGRVAKSRYYTVEQINDFLNATKNQRKPEIEMFFVDLRLFVESSLVAMKKATLDELDQPKRYRLKKFVSAVRKRLKKNLKES